LDSCRIAWGQVAAEVNGQLDVSVRPMVFKDGLLALGEPEIRRVTRAIDGKGFTSAAGAGDWVSIHWGWACDVLELRQVENLRRWTAHHLAIANETL
ncbi:MAG TPA: DUF6390 family protein, partial [Anaerolineales bacterium]|nr:DUF6390 family protein [Anaerolineales bacterium]